MSALYMLFILSLMLLPAAGHTSDSVPVPVSGKVADADRQPVSNVRIEAWPADVFSLDGAAPHRSSATDKDGRFTLTLPKPGEYYFFGRGAEYHGYYGRNPVRVPRGGIADLALGVQAVASSDFDTPADITQGVIGRVSYKGQPMNGVTIQVYLDPSSRFKGMGFAMFGPTDENGEFQAQLSEGTYYLVARMRQSGAMVGPLRAGDFIGYWPGNPLSIEEGRVERIGISLQEVPDKVTADAAHLFGDNSISGQVVDAEGKPVPGLRVLLYDNPRMLDRPLFVSQPTDADGAYVLSFPEAGRYYLRARSNLGGEPVSGELMGDYVGTDDYSLKVESGEQLEGIDIEVEALW